jgi:hypothetical protein
MKYKSSLLISTKVPFSAAKWFSLQSGMFFSLVGSLLE